MSYMKRTYDCAVCGQETTRKRHAADPRICVDCGLKAAAQAAREMAAKSGPAWDRFTEVMRARYADPESPPGGGG